jgi:hypothetical protein
MASDEQQRAIVAFWQWFQTNRDKLDSLADPSDRLWDTTLEKLKAIEKRLWFEMSNPEITPREFVLTAEGKAELFPLVDEIVKSAPEISGWTFVGLKPPMGFDFEITYEGIEIDPKSLSFLPLEDDGNRAAISLRIGVRDYNHDDERPISNAVLVILDTALGERAAATEVQCVEVGPLPQSPEREGYVPLPDLPRYIEWRKQKRQKS